LKHFEQKLAAETLQMTCYGYYKLNKSHAKKSIQSVYWRWAHGIRVNQCFLATKPHICYIIVNYTSPSIVSLRKVFFLECR